MTIEQIWEYGKEKGSDFYSPYISDVDYLNKNHYIVHSGGIVKVSNIMSDDAFLSDMEGSFKHKFAKKPEVIDGNMNALKMALSQVKQIQ